jgi:hypothetical protein
MCQCPSTGFRQLIPLQRWYWQVPHYGILVSLPLPVVSLTNRSIVVRMPPGDTVSGIQATVTVLGQTATLTNAWSYIALPTPVLSTLSPSTGMKDGGYNVTLSGLNFLPSTSAASGGVAAIVTLRTVLSGFAVVLSLPVLSATAVQLVVLMPPQPEAAVGDSTGGGNLTVTVNGQTSSSLPWTYRVTMVCLR